MQIHKKSGRVPDFLYFEREKVSEWELSDDFGTAYGSFLLVGETVVSRQPETASDGKSEAVFYTFGEFYRRMNGFGESLQVKNADYSETSGVER